MLGFEVEDVTEFSGLGDSFVNLIYSLAVSSVSKKPVSKRVSNYILSEALIRSGLRHKAGPRLDRHGMADYAECIIFDAWINNKITLKECVDILSRELQKVGGSFRDASIKAFTKLMRRVEGGVEKPTITVDAVVEKDNKVLLIKRRNAPFKDYWALPGGFIEYGESAEEAVRREVKEEANLDIKIKGLLGVYSDPNRDPRGHIISICFVAQGRGKGKGATDAKDATFFPMEELKGMKLAFDHSKILRDYKRYKDVL